MLFILEMFGKYNCTGTEQEKSGLLDKEVGSEDELLLQTMLTPISKGFSLQGPPKSYYLSPMLLFKRPHIMDDF